MEININSELAIAHNKVILAQQKLDQLTRNGKSRRDDDVKYWNKQLGAWTGYINELNKLKGYGCVELTKTFRADGGFHVSIKHNGHHVKGHPFFSQDALPSEIFDSLVIEDDYSLNNPPCKRCGTRGTQLHHWAPKEFFEDAEQWPQDYLCKTCHELWHNTITIPLRTFRQREERANVNIVT